MRVAVGGGADVSGDGVDASGGGRRKSARVRVEFIHEFWGEGLIYR